MATLRAGDAIVKLLNILFVLLCMSALTLAGLTAQAMHVRAEYERGQPVTRWKDYASVGRRDGPKEAPVTVVVFTDYQCPFSRILSRQLKRIREEMPEKVAVVYRNFPLGGHAEGSMAAKASFCADAQGKFREFHDVMTLAGPAAVGRRPWQLLAIESGIADTILFSRCLGSSPALASLNADTTAGNALGVTATPTYLINGRKYSGIHHPLDSLIEAAAESGLRK